MKHLLIDRIGNFVRENTSGEARNQLLHLEIMAAPHYIVVDCHIFTEELYIVLHICKQSTNTSCKMDDVGRMVLLKDRSGGLIGAITG
jgi:hypothetical protein